MNLLQKTMTVHLSLLLLLVLPTMIISQQTNYDPICPDGYSGYVAGPGCTSYFICTNGVLASPITECGIGTIFNELISVCDLESNYECGSTRMPTNRPTHHPTVSPTPRLFPTTESPTLPPQTRSPSANVGIEDALEYAKHDMNSKLFVYQTGWSDLDLVPSTIYRYDGFLRGLQLMYIEGVGDMTFYLGEDVSGQEGTKLGLVNIAAFIAQSMKETIKYDSCDENNWDVKDGKYPLSNSCGQLEQSYQDYVCPEGYEFMQCDVDPNMEQKASTQANWYGAPQPFFCGPKSKYPFTGYWDYGYMCDHPWKNPPQFCEDYPGQKGGQAVNDEPVPNGGNRTDVEGCCWWGRGVIQTTGICNFGMLNYYLGKRAADEGRDSRYPNIDFCKDPGAVCTREEHPELKWIAGMFYWMRSLQTYDNGWNYMDNLKSFVRGGMVDETFIDSVSGIVNRGCHNPPCGTGPLDGGSERKANFEKVIGVLFEPDGTPRVFRRSEEEEVEDKSQITVTVEEDEVEDWSAVATTTIEEEDEEEDWSEVVPAENEEEEEEEDWSGASGSNSSMNLYCGETQDAAISNCGRNGYSCNDGVCLGSMKCFMVGDSCGKEEDIAAAKPVTTAKPIAAEANTRPPPTAKPALSNNIGLLGQYCLKSLEVFDTDCPTAKICEQAEDCPSGTYCWGERMCGGSFTTNAPTSKPSPPPVEAAILPTYSPSEPWLTYSPTPKPQPVQFDVTDTYWCGKERVDAATSCHKRCRSGSDEECDEGESCFGYTSCEVESSRAPTTKSETKGPITSQPIQNPTPPPTVKVNNEHTDTPQSTDTPQKQLFCASSIMELETSCGIAQSCMSGPCPSGLFCFPFTCTTAITQEESVVIDERPVSVVENQQQADESITLADRGISCPQSSFVGWHTSTDCTEYFQCNNGAMGSVYVCGSSQKFDKVRNQCQPAENVNSFCYGPAMAKEQAQLCKEDYTGWESRSACREYYYCDRGVADVIMDCGQDLLFDKTLELCNFAHQVKCDDAGKPITNQPTPPPSIRAQQTPMPLSFTPLQPLSTSTPQSLPPTISEPPSPSAVGNDSVGNNSSSPAPTVIIASNIPPWLELGTIMTNDVDITLGASYNSQLFWLLVVLAVPFQIALFQW